MKEIRFFSKQAILTFVGSNFIQLTAGMTAVWGSSSIYYLSYFYHQDYDINNLTNSLILIATVVPLSIIILYSTKICDKLGYQNTIRICSVIFFLSHLAIYVYFSLVTMTIFLLVIPISALSVSLIPSMNLLWSYFLQKKSMVTAINIVFNGIGGIVWNAMFIHLVNPQNIEAQIYGQGDAYFGQPIISNVLISTKIIFFFCSLSFIIGAFLIKDNGLTIKDKVSAPQTKNQEEIKQIQNKKEDSEPEKLDTCERTNDNKPEKLDTCERTNDNKIEHGQINGQFCVQSDAQMPQKPLNSQALPSSQLVIALKDSRCLIIFGLLIVMDIYPIYLLNNFKVIYMPVINNDHFQGYCMMANTAANILGAFLWGYFGDKKGILFTLLVIVSINLLGGVVGFFSSSPTILIIFMIIIGISDRGMETIAGPALIQIFNLRIATLLLPYKGLSLIIGFLIAPIIQILTSSFFSPFQYLKFLFSFCLFSFILGAYYFLKFRKFGLQSQKFAQNQKQ